MQSGKALAEAERVMVFCNACRYCEGFCAVFPAMELRRNFCETDLNYLANLCHNCRDCYYACQYAPPHEFALNIPQTLAELRLDTYQKFCRPRLLAGLFRRNALVFSVIAALCIIIIFLLTVYLSESAKIFATHLAENAFYKVIAYDAVVLPASAVVLLILAILFSEFFAFWNGIGGKIRELASLRAHFTAARDAFSLKYLDGGGIGCNYPDERFSMARRWLHHFVVYGLMLCFAATTTAAVYEHFFNWSAPYPIWSWPVLLGTTGGAAMLVGTGGLFYLKLRMDGAPATARSLSMDISFLALLFLTSLTGLVLLVVRITNAMGTLLIIHLGFVAALFITMPYGKFIHALFRYAALLKNAVEQFNDKI